MGRKKQGQPPDPAFPIQVNVRVSREMDAALDRWTAETNYTQGARMTRAELLRALFAWGIEHRPNLKAK